MTTTTYTEQQLEAITKLGSLWVSSDGSKQRVYFNDLTHRMQRGYNLKIAYYNSGNVSSATIDGEKISNSTAKQYLASVPAKVWFDLFDMQFHFQGDDKDTFRKIIRTIKADAGIE